jgi:6-phosphogluconolactonase/glucosamine-6-phosphate isomerase/deaminase
VGDVELRVGDDPAGAAGHWLAHRLRDAVRRRGAATLAVSGGSSAPPMFAALLHQDVPWEQLTVWQVDERVVPDGHAARNALQLLDLPVRVRPMPVTAADLRAAARRYGSTLPDRFDVVHLGLGDDGHTASWPPGDPVVDSARPCEVVGEFNGLRRMTLTPPVINAARSRLVLASGAAKAPMVARWLLRDPELPIDRVRRSGTWTFLDRAAAELLPGSG